MKITENLILGLLLVCSSTLFFAPELYASEYTEEDAKRSSAAMHADIDDEDTDTTTQQIPEELSRLAKQTPAQTAQADELMEAVESEDTQKIEALLASKADVNARTSENSSALHQIHVFHSRPDIVQLLLTHNASTNSIDSRKRTPLHICCAGIAEPDDATTQSLLLLLNVGAHVNAQDDSEDTPLCHLEPLSGLHFGPKEDYVPLLLEWGANPNICHGSGRSTLDSLRYKLGLDTYAELRAPLCKIILSLDAHRKKLDATTAAIQSIDQFPLGGAGSTDRIVVEYLYGSSRPDDKKLDALLKDFDALLQEFHTHGAYGTYSTQCNTD